MEKLFYEVHKKGLIKTTINHDEAIDALYHGFSVVEVQETVLFTPDTVIRTTVSRELKIENN
jgi:S-adenosylhomocysteine hydrolase